MLAACKAYKSILDQNILRNVFEAPDTKCILVFTENVEFLPQLHLNNFSLRIKKLQKWFQNIEKCTKTDNIPSDKLP